MQTSPHFLKPHKPMEGWNSPKLESVMMNRNLQIRKQSKPRMARQGNGSVQEPQGNRMVQSKEQKENSLEGSCYVRKWSEEGTFKHGNSPECEPQGKGTVDRVTARKGNSPQGNSQERKQSKVGTVGQGNVLQHELLSERAV